MHAGGVGLCKDKLEEPLPHTDKCYENDKSWLLPVQHENQSDTATTLQSSLYAQNNIIMSLLKSLENELLMRLEKYKEEIRDVDEHIAMSNNGRSQCRKYFNCLYCPDFKLPRFFGDLSNADTLMKKANQELRLTDMHPPREWSEFHRAELQKAIADIETKKKMQESNEEIWNLKKALEKTEDLTRKAEIESKLKSYETSAKIFKMTANNLFSRLGTEYDWDSISKNVFRGKFASEECRAMWHFYMHPKINKNPLSDKEMRHLEELADKYRYQDWDGIAKELGTNRSGVQCAVHYLQGNQTLCEGSWSKVENEKLKNAVQQLAVGSSIPWNRVANYLPGRSKKQVWEHWTYTLNPLIKKGAFTKEENMLLVAGVQKHGTNYGKVAEMFQNRTPAQLRHRYITMSEQPKLPIKWSPQDDALLLNLVKKYGEGRWKKISYRFRDFNRTQVRQHYKVLKKREQCQENVRNLVETTSNLVYGTNPNVDGSKRLKLQETLLPIRKHTSEPVVSLSANFNEDCFSLFQFMYSNPYPKEMKKEYENKKVERTFHVLSCLLHFFKARLLIPEYDKSLLSHHLLIPTDRQIISLLDDHHLATEKETRTSGSLDCKVKPVSEEEQPFEDDQDISVISEADSAIPNLIKYTIPLNYTTLGAFQSVSLYCELHKEKIAVDVTKPKGRSFSLLEQRMFSLFFWPLLASKVPPQFTGSRSDAEEPKVLKKSRPSKKKKRRGQISRKEKVAALPQKMKRNYVKSGKYKRAQTTETSEKRRSSRIASMSVA